MTKYLIAHDLGTSGNKASLFSVKGELVSSYTKSYGVDFFDDNKAEQEPDDWFEAVKVATEKVTEGIDKNDVLAMSFSSQMQACVVVDEKGTPLRKAMIWADLRAQKQADQLEEKIGFDRMYQITGHRVSPSYSIEKLMWIKENEPDIYEQTHKMLLAKDYVIQRLTGEFVTDYSEASGTNALDLSKLCWSKEILEAAEIDIDKMPELHTSTDVIGSLQKEMAEELGLSENTAIVCGGGDGPCSALGAGCIEEGKLFMTLGTSAWIGGTTKDVFLDEKKVIFCFAHVIPGKYMPCATMQAAGSAYNYIKDALCDAQIKEAKELGCSPFDLMNQLVKDTNAGANGLVFLPYMLGERSPRWNPNTSGSFLGIKMEHTKGHYLRAVLEGVAMNMELILQAYKEHIDVDELVLSGGGAKGKEFVEILSEVLEVTLNKLDKVETATSIAAAVIAGVGIGVFKDFTEIKRFVQVEESIVPTKEFSEVYRRNKEVFNEAYECLLPLY